MALLDKDLDQDKCFAVQIKLLQRITLKYTILDIGRRKVTLKMGRKLSFQQIVKMTPMLIPILSNLILHVTKI